MSQTSGRSKTGSVRFKVKEHLLIPFGCPKWDISKIKITGVSTEATYFESETPCVYIDKTERKALTLENVPNVFPVEPGGFPTQLDSLGQYEYIKEFLKKYTDPKTEFENLFLDIYFQHFKEAHRDPHWFSWRNKIKNPDKLDIKVDNPNIRFRALLPLPQAHLHLKNPLDDARPLFLYDSVPAHMFKVDFVFWDGKALTAIEIDGSSHIGSEVHIQKDRMLQRAGVLVIHILNSELVQYRTKAIESLLPTSILYYWEHIDTSELYFPFVPFF